MAKLKTTNSQIKVEAKGCGMNGKIVIKAHRFHKIIPAVFFSSKEADLLLRMVDEIERERLNSIYS
ncbi:MAG: hypothetical protein JFR41_00820 [Muribaculaceae bacterium]|nr:hypothetical protein [Muribaculaceae bacterium]